MTQEDTPTRLAVSAPALFSNFRIHLTLRQRLRKLLAPVKRALRDRP